MKGKMLETFEAARDHTFAFIVFVIIFFAILSISIMLSIKAPGLLKFMGLLGIVGAFYFLLSFPTVTKLFKQNN